MSDNANREKNFGFEQWISVELPSDEGNTAFLHINLLSIEQVAFVRKGKTDEILMAQIFTHPHSKSINLKEANAQFFHDAWVDFIGESLTRIQEKAEPSIIHTVGPGALAKLNN